jgi:hypothetical protein
MLWCFNAFLRLLLKGMQYIDLLAELDGQHRAVGFGVLPQGDLEYAAAYPLERLGVPGHAAELDQLQLIADDLLSLLGECPQVPT